MSSDISDATATRVALDAVKKRKNSEKIEVTIVEHINADWVVRGTCPINMEGHPWVERFEVIVDPRGRVKSVDFSLL
jgi:hypothetical protein